MAEEKRAETAPTIRDGYDRWATVYDHDLNPLVGLEEPVVHRALGDVSGVNVLELGCGTGRHTAWLARHGAKVTALDFSAGMLAEARRKVPEGAVSFLSYDLHDPFPFPDGTFDLAISGLVLEHLRELNGFFVEMRRAIRPDGRAIVSAMHPAMFLRGSQARFTDPESGMVVQPGSFPHQVGDFVMAALAAGFRIEGITERAPDAEFASRYPRAEKYIGWPMLVVLELAAGRSSSAP